CRDLTSSRLRLRLAGDAHGDRDRLLLRTAGLHLGADVLRDTRLCLRLFAFQQRHQRLIPARVVGAWNCGSVFLICASESFGSRPYFSCMPCRTMFWVSGVAWKNDRESSLLGVGMASSTPLVDCELIAPGPPRMSSIRRCMLPMPLKSVWPVAWPGAWKPATP